MGKKRNARGVPRGSSNAAASFSPLCVVNAVFRVSPSMIFSFLERDAKKVASGFSQNHATIQRQEVKCRFKFIAFCSSVAALWVGRKSTLIFVGAQHRFAMLILEMIIAFGRQLEPKRFLPQPLRDHGIWPVSSLVSKRSAKAACVQACAGGFSLVALCCANLNNRLLT